MSRSARNAIALILLCALDAQAHEPEDGEAPREGAADVGATPANVTISPEPGAVPQSGHTHEAAEPVEVFVKDERPASESASRLFVGRRELELRSRRRPADVLEAAPGLFVAQHAGGGKANQYFLRGFDADHGTDVAFFVDGIPVNSVSHGHGQGYTDMSFVIPELVVGVDVFKGPYYAQFGDFATAGAVNLRFAEVVPENFASASVGQYGIRRGVVVASPALGEGWRSVVAAEVAEQDGPFVHAEDYGKFNIFARTTRDLGLRSKLALTWMSYGGRWNGSGQIPARAVCGEGEATAPPPSAYGQPCVDRFGSIDPSEGGATQRHTASISYSLTSHSADLDALLYAGTQRFNLHSNFTFFARNPLDGDGIEQTDERTIYGADVRARRHVHYGTSKFSTSLGLQVRADAIDNALYDQRARERIGERVVAHVNETAVGAYIEEDARLTRALRLITGMRVQRIDVAVDDQREDLSTQAGSTSGTADAMLLLPKFSAIVTPIPGWDLFGHSGRGFHSNDARGAVLDAGAVDLMTAALGYEIGSRVEPVHGVTLQAGAFLLDLDSELVWVGDDGVTEASGATRRAGVEAGIRARLENWLFADLDVTFTRAVFRENSGNADSVALAPTRTLSAGIGARPTFGKYTPFGSIRLKSLADRPATDDGSLTAEGFTLVDAEAGLRYGPVEGALSVQNVLDTRWREVNFATTSRLSYEPAPVTGIHYTPGWPRTVLARATLYWE